MTDTDQPTRPKLSPGDIAVLALLAAAAITAVVVIAANWGP